MFEASKVLVAWGSLIDSARHQPLLTADKLIVSCIQVKKESSKTVHFVGWTISQDSVGMEDQISIDKSLAVNHPL